MCKHRPVALTDRELADRFPSGDDEIVRAVYGRFGGAVHTVAMSILGDAGRAADVVQATFVNAWQASHRFDPSRELGPWLYTIARRQAIDAYRRERRSEPTDPSELDIVELPPVARTGVGGLAGPPRARPAPGRRARRRALVVVRRARPSRDRRAARRADRHGEIALVPGAQATGVAARPPSGREPNGPVRRIDGRIRA